MRLRSKMALNVFEAAEACGVSREELTAPLGYDARHLVEAKDGFDWDILVAVLDRLWNLLDRDVERLRDVGRQLVTIPSYAFLRRAARGVMTPRSLYEIGERWLAPADAPHVYLRQEFPTSESVIVRASIPPPHAASAPFLYIFEGLLTELPRLLDLPRAVIEQDRITPRDLEAVLRLPKSNALPSRLRRRVSALLHRPDALALFEQQRREIAESLEAVQRSTQEMRALFQNMPDYIVIHRDGHILWTNRTMVVGLGYDDDDALVGRTLFDITAPSFHPVTAQRMRGQADQNAPEMETGELVRKDGSIVIVEISPTRYVSFGGHPARLVIGRDVTERVRLQQRLSAADRMASVGILAAGVAHEVNNPLAYVLNNIEMVIRELTPMGEQTAKSREKLAVALQGVDHIRVIVRDLLALSRTEEIGVGSVDVRHSVESMLTLASQKIAERAELVAHYEEVPLARGTPARLGQVLLNLLSNALEALPLATRAANRLEVSVRRSDAGGVLVEVADNGVGIAPEHQARIFDPFFTTKPFGSGTGLGLSISQRIIGEIGGALTFESLRGRGSTFRLHLAAAADPESRSSAPPRSAPRVSR